MQPSMLYSNYQQSTMESFQQKFVRKNMKILEKSQKKKNGFFLEKQAFRDVN